MHDEIKNKDQKQYDLKTPVLKVSSTNNYETPKFEELKYNKSPLMKILENNESRKNMPH